MDFLTVISLSAILILSLQSCESAQENDVVVNIEEGGPISYKCLKHVVEFWDSLPPTHPLKMPQPSTRFNIDEDGKKDILEKISSLPHPSPLDHKLPQISTPTKLIELLPPMPRPPKLDKFLPAQRPPNLDNLIPLLPDPTFPFIRFLQPSQLEDLLPSFPDPPTSLIHPPKMHLNPLSPSFSYPQEYLRPAIKEIEPKISEQKKLLETYYPSPPKNLPDPKSIRPPRPSQMVEQLLPPVPDIVSPSEAVTVKNHQPHLFPAPGPNPYNALPYFLTSKNYLGRQHQAQHPHPLLDPYTEALQHALISVLTNGSPNVPPFSNLPHLPKSPPLSMPPPPPPPLYKSDKEASKQNN